MASPSWFVYTGRGYDKRVDWDIVSEISEVLLNNLYDWFGNNGWLDEMRRFQHKLKEEVDREFEPVNRNNLIPIIEQIEHERPSGLE